jgi:hypothetical protein
MRILLVAAGILAAGSVVVGCAARSQTPVEDAGAQGPNAPGSERESRPGDVLEKTGDVSLKSFALAGRVAWAGIRSAGGAIGGLFRGGPDEAEQTWDTHAAHTRDVARREADHVREAARKRRPEPPVKQTASR